jgi:dihydroanticapsin dehydrogenase
MYDGISNRVVLVTGGAQGIGRAICEVFLAHGSGVMVADLDEEKGVRVEHELSRLGRCQFARTDIADEENVIATVKRTVDVYGRLDFLVNCASAFIMRGVDASVAEWRRMLEVNVMGTALCVKHAVPHMRAAGGGAIVSISSISAFIAQDGLLTYNTTKAAISSFTRLAAMELAPHGIRVNAVCPATVWSENNADVIRRTYGLDRAGADAHPEIGGKTMLGRVADPLEIAKVVLFLASNDASYITAANVMVDGGYTAL